MKLQYVGVLFGLGVCMILAAWCMYFIEFLRVSPWAKNWSVDYWIPLLFAALIVIISQLIIQHDQKMNLNPGFFESILLLGGEYHFPQLDIDINFTPLPWFPSVAFGLIVGKIFTNQEKNRLKWLRRVTFSFFLTWFILRTANIYGLFNFGDYKIPSGNEILNWQAYLSVSKFPPSLCYFLWSWAINLAGILIWFKLEKHFTSVLVLFKPLKVFGQSALFFFIGHWFVYLGLSLLLPGKLSSLPSLVVVWLAGLMILYPLCRGWYQFKSRQSKESIWRMF